ncbi:MAG: DUF5640 domain-containing protein [Lachnospiraceae bacterium]|nr:DUF5640 domain-containing protein [Lachnospiraceae bacterium]
MKKILAIILVCMLSIACLCGCGDKKPEGGSSEPKETKKEAGIDSALIGTWNEYGIPEEQQLGDYWTFNKDGSGRWGLMDVEFTFTAGDGNLVIDCDEGWGEYKYTYSISGDILTLTEEGSSAYEYQKQ